MVHQGRMRQKMKKFLAILFFASILCVGPWNRGDVFGQFGFLKGGAKIEAEANKEYPLKDSDGLWFIMAKKFNGPEARKMGNQLVYELRKRYKLPAYIFKYDNEQDDLQRLARELGSSRSYQYMTAPPKEYAVLVGSFPAADDPALQKTLLTIKRIKPDSLNNDVESKMTVRQFEILAQKDKEYAGYGPLGKALAVPNPLIPKDYFAQKGVVDPFIAKINSDSRYSLLRNPKMFTLRVATFSGKSVMENEKELWDKIDAKFQDAGIKAAALCSALRKQKIEAWEFHDRDCSFVTIGSFDSYGTPNPDGTIELNPEIHRLMEKYQGRIEGVDGAYQAYCVDIELNGKGKQKIKMKIPFDLQPFIIMVPQLPENVKKIQAVHARRQKEERRNEAMRLKESLTVGNEVITRIHGDSDRDFLSEGRRVTDEEIARMIALERGEAVPDDLQTNRISDQGVSAAPSEIRAPHVASARAEGGQTNRPVGSTGYRNAETPERPPEAAAAPQTNQSYRNRPVRVASPKNAAPTF